LRIISTAWPRSASSSGRSTPPCTLAPSERRGRASVLSPAAHAP
jgi:hypothetical protein